MDHYYVYILQSRKNGTFYKGSTNDLVRRFCEHNQGKEESTRRYVPWELVWYAIKPSRSEAMVLEKKLKNLTTARIIAMIDKYPCENPVVGPDVARVRQS